MFSYVDPSVAEKLISDGKLRTVDFNGELVSREDDKAYLSVLGPVPMPRKFEVDNTLKEIKLNWYCFVRRTELSHVVETGLKVSSSDSEEFRQLVTSSMCVNSVLAFPGFETVETPLVRVHSNCLTGDVFGSLRCDCRPQLVKAFDQISESDGGAIVYMSGHEGRGIGLWAKAATYLLQDEGQNTYQANRSLGLPEDSRDFSDAAVVLKFLTKGKSINLISNNPEKKRQLEASGQRVASTVPIMTGKNEYNKKYLSSKKEKGHFISDEYLGTE
ncbi:MAG: hypothetical protein CBC29_08425 [Methylococcaceae bacterium TMED69]|nr:MAG: hypothetical protein CBC29_08425 [Methylococcaceae bacterium TMED69]